ncbi:hypothetical protein HW555_002754 [Spodoptera exigua]|uniref:Uncharacterized protein n=1 Tax=Spodoptera exigua TaxID=7107 RepID=A0A835L6U4_SPOEX|nr:hypothetical protein HW555_002754 [Spodoptera exigua]
MGVLTVLIFFGTIFSQSRGENDDVEEVLIQNIQMDVQSLLNKLTAKKRAFQGIDQYSDFVELMRGNQIAQSVLEKEYVEDDQPNANATRRNLIKSNLRTSLPRKGKMTHTSNYNSGKLKVLKKLERYRKDQLKSGSCLRNE